jgi:hypothetical protein
MDNHIFFFFFLFWFWFSTDTYLTEPPATAGLLLSVEPRAKLYHVLPTYKQTNGQHGRIPYISCSRISADVAVSKTYGTDDYFASLVSLIKPFSTK